MADLPVAPNNEDDLAAIPVNWQDAYSWGRCPTPADRSSTNLGLEEIRANLSVGGKFKLNNGWLLGRLNADVFQADFYGKETNGDGFTGESSQTRHVYPFEGNAKDGAFDENIKANVYLQNDFTLNRAVAFPLSSSAFSLMLGGRFTMAGLGTAYNNTGSTIDRGTWVSLDSGETNGISHAAPTDGTAPGQIMGQSLEEASDGSEFAYQLWVPGTVMMAANVSAAVGDAIYVDASGDLTATAGSNTAIGTLLATGSSTEVMMVASINYSF